MRKITLWSLALLTSLFSALNATAESVTVTLQYAPGLESCLNTIRDWTESKFIFPENNQLEVEKGNDIAFNFLSVNDGFSITDILVNGVSRKNDSAYKYTFNNDNVQIRFKVNENVTLKVEGSAASYAQIPMTAYVMNPEGVKIKIGTYSEGTYLNLSGTPLTQPIELAAQVHTNSDGVVTYTTPAYTLTPANAKKINFTIDDRKYYNAYISPADGWYIATVQNASFEETNYIDKDYDHTFYVVALPLPNNQTATVNVDLSANAVSNLSLKCNTAMAANWENPESTYSVKNGANIIRYTDGYQTPFTLASKTVSTTFNCELDGRVLTSSNTEGAVSYALDFVNGSVVNAGTTDYAANSGTITLTSAGSQSATYTYGKLNRPGRSGYKLVNGTSVTVTPASADLSVTINGVAVELTNGSYTFTVDGPANIAVGSGAEASKFTQTIPAEGEIVSEFDTYTVYLPALKNEHMFYFNPTKLGLIKLTDEDGTSLEASAIEPAMDEYGATYYTISFETIDEPGRYTVTIPEGFFFEAEWSDATNSFVAVDGGQVSEAFTGTFTVGPKFDLSPAPGSTISELVFTLSFPNATEATFCGSNYELSVSQGQTYAAPGMNVVAVSGAPCPTFTLSMLEGTSAPFGQVTLSINEGAFAVDGLDCPYITAVYTYEGQFTTDYTIEPAGDNILIPADEYLTPYWTLIFDEATTVQDWRNLTSTATVTVNGQAVGFEAMAEVNMLMMQLSSKEGLKDGDVLRVQIPAGAFKISGEESPAVDHSWILAEAKSYSWTSNPADGSTISELKEFTLTFVEEGTTTQPQTATLNENHAFADVKLGYAAVAKADISWVRGGEFKVTLPEGITENGTYTINFAYGTFMFDGCQMFEESFDVTFTIDTTLGISDISVNGSDRVNVVSINGRVIPNANPNRLPAGIYLINGIKTLVK